MNIEAIDIWEERRYLLTNEICVIDHIVKPILGLLGWNIDDTTQVTISGRAESRCDVHLLVDSTVVVGLECKALTSNEFRITTEKGDIRNSERGDGVAQLKKYCRLQVENQHGHSVIPAITNGLRWVVFNAATFLSGDTRNEPIQPSRDILVDTTITETSFLSDVCALRRDALLNRISETTD